MEGELLQKHKEELAKKSIERLKCIVCFERIPRPLTFCRTGHLCCKSCRKDLNDCPVCQRDFSSDKNIAFEQLMLDICLFPCKNEIYGCTVIDDYDAINKHERLYCDFKQLKCFLSTDDTDKSSCGKIIAFYSFEKHIVTEHSKHDLEVKSELVFDENKDYKTIKVIDVLMKDVEDSENVSYDADNEILSVGYHYVGAIKDAKKYKYTVTIKDSESSTIITAQDKCVPIMLNDKNKLKSCKSVNIDIGTFDDFNEDDDDDDDNDEDESNEDESDNDDGDDDEESDEDEEYLRNLSISVVFDFAENNAKKSKGIEDEKKENCVTAIE